MKKSEYITVRTDPEIKEYLELRAAEEERTLSWIVNKILADYIFNKKKLSAERKEENK